MGLLRTIEVFYNIGFNRVAQSSLDAVMVLPGIMSAYRREALTRLGGFATGINGEDTDMSVRIGRLGYRLLVDMRIRVYTEVPGSFAHLREQRLRWSRSLYHVISRNMSAIRMLQGPRGIWVLTSAVYFSTRRLVTIPLIIYALILLAINPADPALRQGAAIGAMVIGPQIFILAVTLLVYRRFLYIPFIPAFLLFRMLRGYFALESFFTLRSMAPATAPAVAPTLAPQVAVADLRTARLVPSGAANGVSSPGPWKANGSVHANDSPFHPDNARGAARRSHGATNGKRGPEAPGWTAADRAGWPTPGTARSRSRKIFE
jgi:cellulose synthase/poly-beta-1,6-N-acetylglucosamine synthase-like glycosyltransferase